MPGMRLIEQQPMPPVEEGDAYLVLKRDGTFRMFNKGAVLTGGNLSREEQEQRRKLDALSVALQMPDVMMLLYDIAEDPAVTEALVGSNAIN